MSINYCNNAINAKCGGSNSESDYQLAQKNGYEGTEQEWITRLFGEPANLEDLTTKEYVDNAIAAAIDDSWEAEY